MNQHRKTISLGKRTASDTHNPKPFRPFLYTGLIFGLLISLVMISVRFTLTLSDSQRLSLLQEGGPIESASALMYVPTIIVLIGVGIYQYLWRSKNDTREAKAPWGPMYPWTLAAFVSCFIARELDFQKRFTTVSVSKTRFYFSSEIPLLEKMIGIVVVAAIAFLVLRLFAFYWPRLTTQFKRCQLSGILPAVGMLLIVFSNIVDKGSGFVAAKGAWRNSVSATEELSEVLIPVLFFSIVLIAIKPRGATVVECGEDIRALDTPHMPASNGNKRAA